MAEKDNPLATSVAYDAMAPYWRMVDAILAGVEELRRASTSQSIPGPQVPYANLRQLRDRLTSVAASPYLPAYESETPGDYTRRRLNSPLTNIYADASENLCSKPFSKELQLEEGTSEDLISISENIDGQGHSLHVFGEEVFKKGVDKGIHWVMVDFPKVPGGATLADEREIGARPYWVHIPAERMLAVYSVFYRSSELIYHARIYEPCWEQSGYSEVLKRRVRVLKRDVTKDGRGIVTDIGPPYYELWEEQEKRPGQTDVEWMMIDAGTFQGVTVIPLVPFVTGKRDGTSWKLEAPLHDLAHMQITEFQMESGLQHICELAAFPMLAGQGVKPQTSKLEDGSTEEVLVPVGPAAVLFAPPDASGNGGRWEWIEPDATSLNFLQTRLEKFQQEMRNVGKQPMASANLTVVTTANVSMKASSAVQAWAILFKDAMEQCWQLTCEWLKQTNAPGVNVHTDFGVELEAGKEGDHLLKMEEQGILSKEDTAIEFKRRGVLRDDFDWKTNEERRASDEEGLIPEEQIDPRTGEVLNQPSPRINGQGSAAGGATVQ